MVIVSPNIGWEYIISLKNIENLVPNLITAQQSNGFKKQRRKAMPGHNSFSGVSMKTAKG